MLEIFVLKYFYEPYYLKYQNYFLYIYIFVEKCMLPQFISSRSDPEPLKITGSMWLKISGPLQLPVTMNLLPKSFNFMYFLDI